MDNQEVSSLGNSKEINKTYIISTLTNRRDEASSASRLTLQRRNTNNKSTVAGDQEASENTENLQSDGKRLTLQRRTRAGAGSHPHTSTMTEKRAWISAKVLSEPNSRTGSVVPLRSASLRERGLKNSTKDAIKPISTPVKTIEKAKSMDREQKTASTPTGKTQFERISIKKEVFEKLSAKHQPKQLKQTAVERLKQSSADLTSPGSANKKFPIISQNRSTISSMRKTTTQPSTVLNTKSKPPQCETLVSAESVNQTAAVSSKELKMENSAVTVAVRVRPFSHR